MRKIIVLFLFIFLPMSIPKTFATSCTCAAVPPTLEITSLYPAPTQNEKEWIEIKNTGGMAVDLSNYTLEDTTAKPMAMSGQISPGQSMKIDNLTFQLNNGGDSATLKTSGGLWIDTLTYVSSKEGEIIYKNQVQLATENITQTYDGAISSESPTTIKTPEKIPLISEALPNPAGSDSTDEWIEFYNPFGEEISLRGLYIDDEDGGSNPHALTGSMAAESFLLMYITDSKISLNNTGDSLRILGSAKEVLFETTYEKALEGQSWALVNGIYKFLKNPSPASENIEEPDESSASEESESDFQKIDYANGNLSEEVKLSEVFPNPEGSDAEGEWIEITNGGETEVNLGNWSLDDGGGKNSYTFPDNTIIYPGETLIVERAESKIALNNSGESLELKDFTGEVVDEISYENSIEDESYSKIEIEEMESTTASLKSLGSRISEIWTWTEPTPGESNPVWKQFKGEVTESAEELVTIFDGISNWSFKIVGDSLNKVIFQVGNKVLIRAAMAGDFYEVKDSELLESAKVETKKSFQWEIVTGIFIIACWLVVEYRKRRKMALS